MTQTQHPEFDAETAVASDKHMEPWMAEEIVRQIGWRNMMAISGRRAIRTTHTLILPVAHGYKVVVSVAGNDTYTVRRLFVRGTKVFLHGEALEVDCERISEVCYFASCYVSHDADEWPHQA